MSAVVAALVLASGFSFGELGARAQALGGAFTGRADDLTAIRFNPAGLTQRRGWLVQAELQVRWHEVGFLRQDSGFDPQRPSRLVDAVANEGGAFFAPLGGVAFTFELGGRALSLAVGGYGPPSVGSYRFPAPRYDKVEGEYVATPRRYAPQRYALVQSDTLIAYPTVAAALELHPRVAVGLSVQLVASRFRLVQALFAGDLLGLNPMRQLEEDPDFDALVSLEATGAPTVTGVAGVLVRPVDWLQLGASFRPPVPLAARGDATITLGPALAPLARVEGSATGLALTLPVELAVGAFLTPLPWLGITVDVRYEGWGSIDAITLTPEDIALVQGATRTRIEPVVLPKAWRGTLSGRLGVEVTPVPELSVYAGGLYETQASPDERYSIDFAHPGRFFVSLGLAGRAGPAELVASVAWTPPVTTVVTASEVRRPQTSPTPPAGVIGSGVYTSGGAVLAVALLVHLEPRSPTP